MACATIEGYLEMYAGTSPKWLLTLYERLASGERGNPIDITGYTIKATAKNARSDPDGAAVFQLSTPASGVTILNQITNTGQAELVPPSGATSAITTEKELEFDVKATSPAGVSDIVIDAKLRVLIPVTLS